MAASSQGIIAKDETPGLVDTFYSLVTDIYEWGWGQSFHFAPRCVVRQNAARRQQRVRALAGRRHLIRPPTRAPCRLVGQDDHTSEVAHEVHLAACLQVMPGESVLDSGCGVGGPMRRIASRTGAKVTGITINNYQVERAKKHNAAVGVEKITDVVQGNFLNMPFPDEASARAVLWPPAAATASPLSCRAEAMIDLLVAPRSRSTRRTPLRPRATPSAWRTCTARSSAC